MEPISMATGLDRQRAYLGALLECERILDPFMEAWDEGEGEGSLENALARKIVDAKKTLSQMEETEIARQKAGR